MMALDKALRLTSILLAAASFLGLALGTNLPAWLVQLAGAVWLLVLLQTLGLRVLERLAARVRHSTAIWNSLLVMGFLGFLADMLWISGELLPAGIHFLVLLMVIKLCNLRLRRDYLHLYVISLMALLASAASTTDLWYLPMFLTYLLTGVWTLVLFQLTKTTEQAALCAGEPGLAQQARVTPQVFWMANGLALGTLGFTVVIFFAIPRVSAGFFQSRAGESIRTSGFSDTVQLGAIGPIKRDPSIVMRVELPDPSTHHLGSLYLRGVAYDRYDGKSWTNQFTHRRVLTETSPLTFTVRPHPARAVTKRGPLLRQNILLESLDTAVLFAAPFAETVTGRFPSVQADAVGGLYLPFPSSSRIEYTVVSRRSSLTPADRRAQAVAYPESFVRHFLQIPDESDAVAALAQDITRNQVASYDKAVAIEQYLSKNFRYSLDVPLAEQAHPLEEFLFTRKTGYCEHYATAMVMMLRTVGIPARLVTGFLATEWNEYGNYFLVRQQDAHAWVEVHLPQSGWISMDPTPAVADGDAPPGGHAMARMIDSLRLRWNRFFVQYSAADQLAMVREVRTNSASVGNRAWDSVNAFLEPLAARVGHAIRQAAEGHVRLMIELAGIALISTAFIAWLVRTPPWAKGRAKATMPPEQQAITLLYKTMLDHLSRQGLSKSDATPPVAFLRMVRQRRNGADRAVTTITELYCRARFGRMPPTEDEFHLAQESLRHLKALERR